MVGELVPTNSLISEHDIPVEYSVVDESIDDNISAFSKINHNNLYKSNILIDDPIFNVSALNRVSLNYNDGYISYSIFNCNKINNNLYKMNIYGENIEDISFDKYDIGKFNGFIDVEKYNMHMIFSEYPSDIIKVDYDKLNNNKNKIFRKYTVSSNRLFNNPLYTDINRFIYLNGILADAFYATLCVYSYFVTEVLNTLFPKSFVIVGDTKNGVNILEYYVIDGLKDNIKYDVKNRITHIIQTLRLIVSGRFDLVNYGGVHVKLTITPLETIMAFSLHKTGIVLLVPINSMYNSFSSLISSLDTSEKHYMNNQLYNYNDSPFMTYSELNDICEDSESSADVYSSISLKAYTNIAGYCSIDEFIKTINGG